jgi:hypothetical protein
MHRLAATLLTLTLSLAPVLASADCGPGPDAGLEALGYTWMTARGKGRYVMRMSRRQLKAMTEVRMRNQLFGLAQ